MYCFHHMNAQNWKNMILHNEVYFQEVQFPLSDKLDLFKMYDFQLLLCSSQELLYMVSHLSMTWNHLMNTQRSSTTFSDHLEFQVKIEFGLVQWRIDYRVIHSSLFILIIWNCCLDPLEIKLLQCLLYLEFQLFCVVDLV